MVSRVSHTPTYDQLRGERINVDVPTSPAGVPTRPAEPESLTRPGRHHLRDDAPTAVAALGPSPGSGVGIAAHWPGCRTGDCDPRGKHSVADDPPGTTEVSGPSREPGAGLAESWSWFETGEAGQCRSGHYRPSGPLPSGEPPVVGTHHQPETRKTLSIENYRGKHHMQFFRHSTRFEVLTVLNSRKSS